MTTRQSFFYETKGGNLWNRVKVWNGFTIGTVQWHTNKEWKVLASGATFDQIKDQNYKPKQAFHTQQELWAYLKEELKKGAN